jgi:hypothetical protein
LKIIGGFGYEIEGGGYTAAWNSQNGSIVFSDSPACNWSGIFRMRKTFLSGHGIILRESCGGLNSLSFEDILFESAREPFLTVYALGGSGVWGIDIRGMNFADSQGSGFPVVSAHSPVNRIRNISIMNSSTDGGAPLTAGDAISGLHVW